MDGKRLVHLRQLAHEARTVLDKHREAQRIGHPARGVVPHPARGGADEVRVAVAALRIVQPDAA
eukprot:4806643-Pleurochrysis_carterae.AAC.1